MAENYPSRVPWDRGSSLKEKAAQAGVDFDRLINHLALGARDAEIAADMGVPEEAVRHLRRHFDRYGLHSVEGQD